MKQKENISKNDKNDIDESKEQNNTIHHEDLSAQGIHYDNWIDIEATGKTISYDNYSRNKKQNKKPISKKQMKGFYRAQWEKNKEDHKNEKD